MEHFEVGIALSAGGKFMMPSSKIGDLSQKRSEQLRNCPAFGD